MSEQDNHLFKVIGSIVMGYGIEKPDPETLVTARKIIDLVEKATEVRIIKLLDEYPLPHWSPTEYIEYTEGYITGFQDALALIQGEELLGIDPEDIALIKGKSQLPTFIGMAICELCGNKRCPRAESLNYVCTKSNEPGQTPTLIK